MHITKKLQKSPTRNIIDTSIISEADTTNEGGLKEPTAITPSFGNKDAIKRQ